MKRIAMLLGSLTLCCVFLLASCEEDDEDLPFSYSYDTEAEFTTGDLLTNGYPKNFQVTDGEVQKTVSDDNVTYKITFYFRYNALDKDGDPMTVTSVINMDAKKESGAYTVTSVSKVTGCTENRAAVIKGSLDDEEFTLSYSDDQTATITAMEIKFTRKKD
ncbi:MAG: hypothetical protein J1F14_07505 [Treponema sp.]|nr:hypothetical protein [Treponema sp.]